MPERKTPSDSQRILLVTRPLCEPWDEASKNFAADLARTMTSAEVTILTYGTVENMPQNVTQKAIYSQPHFTIAQKLRLIWFLLRHAGDYTVLHFLFTPTKLNSFIMTKAILPIASTAPHTIQTIATLREDLYTDNDLRKILFADSIVTYSDYAKKRLESLEFTNAQKIYPGINLSKFIPAEKDSTLMQKWGLTNTDIIVAYPGEFARLGATDLIIDAFVPLWDNPETAHIKYLCACRIKNDADARKKHEVIQRLESMGHRDKVIFTDTFGDMNAVYNLSDIVLFPVENMHGKFDIPLAMIEPYACKKPVIATDLPLFAEFSSPAFNVIIPRSTPQALTDAITTLAANHVKRTELGESAYNFVHNTFNITTSATSYEHLYNTITQRTN